jgi:hypothetical protein
MVFTVLVALAELAAAEVQGLASKPWAAIGVERVQAAPQERDTAGEMPQLTNPRTGVTCTLRILKAEPLDKGAVLPAPETSVDPDIRGRGVSPCVD